jgi:hypothetical protein
MLARRRLAAFGCDILSVLLAAIEGLAANSVSASSKYAFDLRSSAGKRLAAQRKLSVFVDE